MFSISSRTLRHPPYLPLTSQYERPCSVLRLVLRIVFVVSLLILLIFLSDAKTNARVVNLCQDVATAFIYRVRVHKTAESPFTLFTSQNPIFTNRISASALRKVLNNRRRIIGGVFNNSLIAACRDGATIHPQAVSSWNSVRGVREVVVVHYASSSDESLQALKTIDAVDKLGRIIYTRVDRKDTESVPTPTEGGRWERARAFNLGATIASGGNLLFVDCDTIVDPEAIQSHTFTNGTVLVRISDEKAHMADAADIRTIEMVYVGKPAFMSLFGFDERIDVPGFDMAELVERLTDHANLKWQVMHPLSSRSARVQRAVPLVIGEWVAGMRTSKTSATELPELALYITAFARNEMAPWTGLLIDGSPSMLTLHPVVLRVLRSQCNSVSTRTGDRTVFPSQVNNDFRLWIHASVRRRKSISILDALPRNLRAALVLKAHRKLLHDQHDIPWKLLMLIEGSHIDENTAGNASMEASFADRHLSFSDVERNVAEYSPIVFDNLWRKSRLLVVSVEAYRGIELFRSVTWAISLAIARSRALILVGHLRGTPLVDLLDVNEMSRVLSREYNVKLDILGRAQALNCSTTEGISCWEGDDVSTGWDEYRVTDGVTGIRDEPSKHLLVHITAKDVKLWDDKEKFPWQQQLEEHAFACLTISENVKNVISQNAHNGWEDVSGKTALWISQLSPSLSQSSQTSSNDTTIQSFVLEYLAQGNTKQERKPLLFLSDHMGRLDQGNTSGNGIENIAELWMALGCDRIVFDDENIPDAWSGTDECIIEWRRIHGVLSTGKGVTHVRSSDVGATVIFHEIIFFNSGLDKMAESHTS